MNTHFSLFRLPETFELDNQILEQRYRTLAAQFHPDKFAAASGFEQKQAVMMTATLNEAHRVLRDVIERAAYLLKLNNIDADSPEHTHFEPEFLMQQMAWRETLMDAKLENNAAALTELAQTIKQAQTELHRNLQVAFSENHLEKAAELVRQGRFLQKLQQEIHAV